MIISICENPDVLSTMRIIKICIQIIKIIVPIILMVSAAITYTKAVTSGDSDLLKKANKAFINKAIAAVAIFMIPTIVGITAKLTSDDFEYMKCISDASQSGIEEANYKKALELVNVAKTTLSEGDYKIAKTAVNNLQDGSQKNALIKELNAVAKKINQKYQQQQQQQTQTTTTTTTQPTTTTTPTGEAYKYSIFLGDSRTNGMKSKVNTSTDFVIATDGANYTHLNDHFTQAKNILNKYPNTKFNIILNYGANIPSGIEKYCSKYNEFVSSISSNNRVFIVSVNPVDDNRSPYVKNATIVSFNNRIRSCVSASNVYYCDVYNAAPLSTWTSSYISDGIHYTGSGYQFIYNQISKCIGK